MCGDNDTLRDRSRIDRSKSEQQESEPVWGDSVVGFTLVFPCCIWLIIGKISLVEGWWAKAEPPRGVAVPWKEKKKRFIVLRVSFSGNCLVAVFEAIDAPVEREGVCVCVGKCLVNKPSSYHVITAAVDNQRMNWPISGSRIEEGMQIMKVLGASTTTRRSSAKSGPFFLSLFLQKTNQFWWPLFFVQTFACCS